MKTIYRLHFPDDAIGQNEAFYSSCAAQGLHLVKRGVYFSRFVSGPPRKDLYRILIAPSCPNDGSQPANSCFAPGEEANPNYISSHGLLHIFRFPAHSAIPVLYASPQQQVAAFRILQKHTLWQCLGPFLSLAIYIGLTLMFQHLSVTALWAQILLVWVEAPALLFLLALLFFWLLGNHLRALVSISQQIHRIKQGVPFDHQPPQRFPVERIIHGLCLIAVVLLSASCVSYVLQSQPVALPQKNASPCLLLADLGDLSARQDTLSDINTLTHTSSFVAEVWQGREETKEQWLFQTVIDLHHPSLAPHLTDALKANRK